MRALITDTQVKQSLQNDAESVALRPSIFSIDRP